MKIVLVANYAADGQESMLRYAELLRAELAARRYAVRLVRPPVLLRRLVGSAGSLAKWVGYVDKYVLAPLWLRAWVQGADVVHICDHSNSMYLRAAGGRPRLITCHDTLAIFAAQGRFPGVQVGATGRLLQRWIARGLVRAPYVVCISEKTRSDVAELSAPRAEPPGLVIPNPVNPFYTPAERGGSARVLSRFGLSAKRYLVHVGSNSWYKNRPGTVRLFAALRKHTRFSDCALLLVGKAPDAELRRAIDESGAAAWIHILAGVQDADLRLLYSDEEALLFPSREEGFGWPVVEAQACGCVVVTSDRDPMREVAGGAAILIDPEQPEAGAERIVQSAGQFEQLRDAGFKNVERFRIGTAIDTYLRAYAQVCEEFARDRSQARTG